MSNLRNEAIKLVEEIPENHLESLVGILKNIQNITGKKPAKKMTSQEFKAMLEKHAGSVDCFKGIDVDAYIRESRGYDRI